MSERQMKFRVGLLAIAGVLVLGVLAFEFGALPSYLKPTYEVQVAFNEAPGLVAGVPVRQYGINIGKVAEVNFDFDMGGVIAVLALDPSHPLRSDALPQLSRSLLGDTSIEWSAGASNERLETGATVLGKSSPDPMKILTAMQETAERTMRSFEETSAEYGLLAKNVNGLIATERGNIQAIVQRAAVSLDELTLAMSAATTTLTTVNRIMDDPVAQANLKRTIAAMPVMLEDAQLTIRGVRTAIGGIEQTMQNLSTATEPLAKHAPALTNSLGRSLFQLEGALQDIGRLSAALAKEDGSISKLASDPALYENLNSSAQSLAILLRNLDPIVADVRVFSDKVARHPELLGVRGAIKGSSGIKQAGFEEPARQ